MPGYRFYCPIDVRYGDLDPQGHVNNASYLTYFEQARVAYIAHLGLWDGCSFTELGFILADAHVTFRIPVLFGQKIQVWVRIARLGNKSLTMEYSLVETGSNVEMAACTTVLVAYDYKTSQTIVIPENWRQVIAAFDGLPA